MIIFRAVRLKRLGIARTGHYVYLSSRSNASEQEPRINQFGIQYISSDLHKKIFPSNPIKSYKRPKSRELLKLAEEHLKHNNLLGKKTSRSDPIKIDNFPRLLGRDLDEHFHKIGANSSEPYLSMAQKFFSEEEKIPERPLASEWVFRPGWTRYEKGKQPREVPFPLEDELVFDVEVMYKRSPYAVICTCASLKAWYGWVSPFLVKYSKNKKHNNWEHLIPLNTLQLPKLVVGYNVSYDRARVLEEYNIQQSKAFFLDGMALHVAVSGICSQQRSTWQKHKKMKSQLDGEETSSFENEIDDIDRKLTQIDVANDLIDDPWLSKGSPNSLANVADFHCNIKMDKTDRDFFSSMDPLDIISNFNNLMDYCAKDVEATYLVSAKLFSEFRKKIPHPVSFAALRHLGTLMLPTTKKWVSYIENAEKIYQKNRDEVGQILKERANCYVEYIKKQDESLKPDYENDPWLSQLDWTYKQPRVKKDGTLLVNQAFLTGYPEWYRDLHKPTVDSNGVKQRTMNVTTRTRITPLLLKLKWEGYPLFWTDSAGWCFKVPFKDNTLVELQAKNYRLAKISDVDHEKYFDSLQKDNERFVLFKVPHPEGPSKRCTSVLAKSYLSFFEKGILTSEFDYALEILELNSTASYWMGNRQRIFDQFVVYSDPLAKKNKFFKTRPERKDHEDMGIILPKLCAMGTITRRATENTWLTASNTKPNRIGSELKAMIEAPKGYAFVGADVDSEELWIAALIGDSIMGIHGGTALGWMTLEGDKNEKTDLHSKTADILGILRNEAKVFNYGRIYGAGVKFATQLLKQCNPLLSDEQAEEMATELYKRTKGRVSASKALGSRMYHGGSESIIFNTLESIAYGEDPKTPVLGASITDALTAKNLNKNAYLTSRINWVIQSSGVDYLHLLIVSMEYLIRKYKVDARLLITVHDELRYLVKEKDKYKVAYLLQISNAWTRAMFCEKLGIKELPQSCAFFSEVDIDFVLRKEVNQECITPSHPEKIPPGESLDIHAVLEKCDGGKILGNGTSVFDRRIEMIEYKSSELTDRSDSSSSVSSNLTIPYVKAQIAVDKRTWNNIMREYGKLKNGESPSSDHHTSLTNNKTKKLVSKRKEYDDYDLSSDGEELLTQILGIRDLNRNPDQPEVKPVDREPPRVIRDDNFTSLPMKAYKRPQHRMYSTTSSYEILKAPFSRSSSNVRLSEEAFITSLRELHCSTYQSIYSPYTKPVRSTFSSQLFTRRRRSLLYGANTSFDGHHVRQLKDPPIPKTIYQDVLCYP